MANMKHFADIDGQTFQLTNVWHDGHVSTKAFHFSGLLPTGERVPATRVVQYKSSPSRHECTSRCMGASGKSACECSCGGRNHGVGHIAK
jgi:hypothetical protein